MSRSWSWFAWNSDVGAGVSSGQIGVVLRGFGMSRVGLE